MQVINSGYIYGLLVTIYTEYTTNCIFWIYGIYCYCIYNLNCYSIYILYSAPIKQHL